MSQHRQGDAGAGAAMGGGDENQVCGAQGVLRIDEARQPPASPLPTAPYPALASIRPLEPWVSTIAIQIQRLPCAARARARLVQGARHTSVPARRGRRELPERSNRLRNLTRRTLCRLTK